MKIIGISGVSRSGKNTFADILEKQLKNLGCSVKQYALANELKSIAEPFLKKHFDLDVWTDDTKTKDIFRPLLVDIGKIKREQTEGKYWAQLLEEKLDNNVDFCIITDIRYDEYRQDEVWWLKQHLNGLLVHITKYSVIKINDSVVRNEYVKPANKEEEKNNPKLIKSSDYKFSWEHVDGELDKLDVYVRPFVTWLKIRGYVKEQIKQLL